MAFPAEQNVIIMRHILKHGDAGLIFPEHSSVSVISHPSTQQDAAWRSLSTKHMDKLNQLYMLERDVFCKLL